jgi:hypothetical protein
VSSLLPRSSLSVCRPSSVSCLFMVGVGTFVASFLSPGPPQTPFCPPRLAQTPGFHRCTSPPAWFRSFSPDHRAWLPSRLQGWVISLSVLPIAGPARPHCRAVPSVFIFIPCFFRSLPPQCPPTMRRRRLWALSPSLADASGTHGIDDRPHCTHSTS